MNSYIAVARAPAHFIFYNAAIGACGKYGTAGRTSLLYEEVRQQGPQHNEITYSALVSTCEQGRTMERALQCSIRCSCRGVERLGT